MAVLSIILAVPCAAAQTRTGMIEAERENKSRTIQKEEISRLESLMLQFKQRKVLERLTAGFNGLRGQSIQVYIRKNRNMMQVVGAEHTW